MQKRFIIHGGDKRNHYLAQILHKQGYNVALWRAEAPPQGITILNDTQLAGAPCVLVLSPAAPPELVLEALRLVSDGSSAFAGRIDAAGQDYAAQHDIRYFNFMKDEAMTLLNAIPTAEGALELAMANTPRTIYGMRVLVLGYGRVGKAVARLFDAAGAQVTVLARSCTDRAHARMNTLDAAPLHQQPEYAPETELVINTIPAMVVDADVLRLLPCHCLVIDLASRPGGVDFDEARRLGIHAIHALALPGIHAPLSAAQYMQESILSALQESEDRKT